MNFKYEVFGQTDNNIFRNLNLIIIKFPWSNIIKYRKCKEFGKNIKYS